MMQKANRKKKFSRHQKKIDWKTGTKSVEIRKKLKIVEKLTTD